LPRGVRLFKMRKFRPVGSVPPRQAEVIAFAAPSSRETLACFHTGQSQLPMSVTKEATPPIMDGGSTLQFIIRNVKDEKFFVDLACANVVSVREHHGTSVLVFSRI